MNGAVEDETDLSAACFAASKMCACHHARRTARAITAYYDRELGEIGTSGAQLTLLCAVASARKADAAFLTRVLMLDKTTLSRNLRLLERDGLVSRAAIPGRTVWQLTPDGEKLVRTALPRWEAVTRDLTSILDDNRYAELVRDLNKLASALSI